MGDALLSQQRSPGKSACAIQMPMNRPQQVRKNLVTPANAESGHFALSMFNDFLDSRLCGNDKTCSTAGRHHALRF